MTAKKISQLPDLGTAPAATDELVIVDSGVTKKVSVEDLFTSPSFSGKVLVGKTSSSVSLAGAELQNGAGGNAAIIGTASVQSLILNRLSTDGDIAQFRKDGTTVGSIGTRSSGLVVGSGDTGLFYDGGGDRIFPESPSGGAARDAAIDLGTSSARFKNLYLSGGVYLGGTGAANHLDDYEEGTWTPRLKGEGGGETGDIGTGYYTKVGRVVHISVYVNGTIDTTGLSGLINISNLPFVPTTWEGGGTISYATSFINLNAEDTTLLLRPFSGSTFRITKGSSVNWLTAGNINTGAMAFMLEGWFIS